MSQIDPLFLRFVQAHDSACPICRRSLEGIEIARCPSCREDLVLDVQMTDPCTRHVVLGAVGLGVGLGFSVSLVAIFVIQLLRAKGMPPGAVPLALLRFLPVLLGAPVLGAGLIVWIRSRRRLRVATRRVKWFGVVACWLLTASFVGWLAINIITGR